MIFTLPNSIGSRDFHSLFSLCAAIKATNDEIIELDGSRVEFIDPYGLSVLGSLLYSLKNKRLLMPWLPANITSYLERMNFFEWLEVENVDAPSNSRTNRGGDLVELTCVESYLDCDTAADKLADAATGTLTDADPNAPWSMDTGTNQFGKFRYPLWYSISELLSNALTHARQKGNEHSIVWVSAQYYKKTGIFKMSIVDNGCGFLATLSKHEKLLEQSHLSAISTALIPKVSCNRDGMLYNTQGNQGVGLTTTSKIAKSALGSLLIVSGDSYLHTRENIGGILPNSGRWDGVAVAFHCRRNRLPSIRVGELMPPGDKVVDVSFEE